MCQTVAVQNWDALLQNKFERVYYPLCKVADSLDDVLKFN